MNDIVSAFELAEEICAFLLTCSVDIRLLKLPTPHYMLRKPDLNMYSKKVKDSWSGNMIVTLQPLSCDEDFLTS